MSSSEPTPIESVRRTHEASRDPRVYRTRAKIFSAVELLIAQSPESISVADIVRQAGISKTSFYTHFSSFDDLALQVVERAYEHLRDINRRLAAAPAFDPASVVRESYERLIRHYIEHRTFYVAVLALPLSREVHTNAVRAMAADIEPWIAGHPNLPTSIRPHLAASLISSAVVGFLDEWLESDFEATADELLEHLLQLLPAWYTGRDHATAAEETNTVGARDEAEAANGAEATPR
ncbi:MAG: TetR/AcrR family transcriptional regulator [Frankiales bacterium]|nr:TetR/AcrR family transcriptional regulator [Frankiales bacterium]